MKRYFYTLLPMAILVVFGSFDWNNAENQNLFNTTFSEMQIDTFDVEAALAELKEQIKGKENEPAEEVFQNIQIMKGFPAGRVLAIMKMAFNGSLGVTCDHCHVPGKWESEEKKTKQVARDMWAMVGKINRDMLANIENLSSPQPAVNCTTCHRGQVKPAMNMGK